MPSEGALVNRWVADAGPTGAKREPLLEVDPSERLDAEAWIDDVDWAPVHFRYQLAVGAASEPFGVAADALMRNKTNLAFP